MSGEYLNKLRRMADETHAAARREQARLEQEKMEMARTAAVREVETNLAGTRLEQAAARGKYSATVLKRTWSSECALLSSLMPHLRATFPMYNLQFTERTYLDDGWAQCKVYSSWADPELQCKQVTFECDEDDDVDDQ